MKKRLKNLLCVCAAFCIIAGNCSCSSNTSASIQSPLNPDSPVTITVWNYYNGDKQIAFDNLVTQFNDTVGQDKGIVVTTVSQSDVDNLADELLKSADQKIGAHDMPNLASLYPETVYILDIKGLIVDLDQYFTSEELSEYVPSFIEEGRLVKDGSLKIFPVSKSSEVFVYNKTDWAKFEQATGTTIESAMSIEGMTKAAEIYYNWTDSLTPDVKEDGKALYGRDAIANYLYIGAAELGHELFVVENDGTLKTDLDKNTFKTLWDNYYIPFINGYYGAYGRYRSDDTKTGSILSLTGSSSGTSYLPTTVTLPDDTSHDIEVVIEKPLMFENRVRDIAVQQGAGYSILKSNEQEEYASAEFLKWFTSTEQNLNFSISSGYSPAKTSSNSPELIKETFIGINSDAKLNNTLSSLLVSSDIFLNHETYSCKPFNGSKEVRSFLGSHFEDVCVEDRQAVVNRIASGMTKEEAIEPYITDEYFDTWFAQISNEITNIVSK